jgi:hypothetical protein
MAHVQVNGRRWFERTNGNTYHSVTVEIDGAPIGTVPFAYGYGDQYIQTATTILERDERFAGKLDGPVYLRYALNDLGHTFSADVTDVPRRKDLHNGGRP